MLAHCYPPQCSIAHRWQTRSERPSLVLEFHGRLSLVPGRSCSCLRLCHRQVHRLPARSRVC